MTTLTQNIVDANTRRARVLELLRQAVIMQIEFWDLLRHLESAMLDGAEMSDKASKELLEHIRMLAAGAPLGPNREIYAAVVDEHVDDAFRLTEEAAPPPTATERYNETAFGVFGRRLSQKELRAGLLVRYDGGSTALARLRSPHAGGWHGTQCMGGLTFIHDAFYEATDLDREIWTECAKWRKP